MRQTQRDITCRFLDELILLLDEERETRECARRPELAAAMDILGNEALDGGASPRTVSLIQAAGVMVALHAMPVGPGALIDFVVVRGSNGIGPRSVRRRLVEPRMDLPRPSTIRPVEHGSSASSTGVSAIAIACRCRGMDACDRVVAIDDANA